MDKLNTYIYNNITITIGSVTTLNSGEEAWVTCTKTSSAFVLNFGIPKGERDPQDPQGEKGEPGGDPSDERNAGGMDGDSHS